MMQRTLDRREFLAAASATAVTAFAGPGLAIEPIQRSGHGRMRLSLAAYSFRRQLQAKSGSEGALNLEGFVDHAAGLGLDGVELTSYFFPKQITAEYLAGLKRRCHVNGLDVTGGAIRNNFTLPEGEKLQHWFDHVEQWAEHYKALGAPVNRVFAGRPPKRTSEAEAIDRAIVNLEKASELSGRRGVMLALENHDFLMDSDRMMEIVKGVDSPWFGVNLDTGNFRSKDPYKDMERAAPYAVNVQVKVNIRRTGSGHEPSDLERVVKILKDAGYSGSVVLEYEEGKPYEEIPRYLETLRKHMEG